jgi:hypothetical protein
MKMSKLAYSLPLLLVLAGTLCAHDPGMHMYIGSKTFSFWQGYDEEFYNALTQPDGTYWGVMTRKFYYIGLTIPDLLTSEGQAASRELVKMLYDYRDTVVAQKLIVAYGRLLGPLYIHDSTALAVRESDAMYSDSGFAPPVSPDPSLCIFFSLDRSPAMM